MFNKKKKHFTKMLKDCEQMVWNQEFARFKNLNIRESIRRQFDRSRESLEHAKKRNTEQLDKKQLEVHNQNVEKLEELNKNLKTQIEDIDKRLHGTGDPSEETIDAKLEAFITLRENIKSFLKTQI